MTSPRMAAIYVYIYIISVQLRKVNFQEQSNHCQCVVWQFVCVLRLSKIKEMVTVMVHSLLLPAPPSLLLHEKRVWLISVELVTQVIYQDILTLMSHSILCK